MPKLYASVPLEDAARHKFLEPFLPLRSNPAPDAVLAAKNKKLITWATKAITPVLCPALQSLARALELDETNDDILPPHEEDDMDVEVQSMVSESPPPSNRPLSPHPLIPLFSGLKNLPRQKCE